MVVSSRVSSLHTVINHMRSAKSSQSSTSTSDSSADSSSAYSSDYSAGQDDYTNQDVMCLVYPDGRTTTITAQSSSS